MRSAYALGFGRLEVCVSGCGTLDRTLGRTLVQASRVPVRRDVCVMGKEKQKPSGNERPGESGGSTGPNSARKSPCAPTPRRTSLGKYRYTPEWRANG